VAEIYGSDQWLNRVRRLGNIRMAGGTTMNMNWLEKLRPQVLAVIIVLGIGAVYLINQGSTGEGATVLGVTAGIATKLIESKD
tara:strand:+ start:3211 stop:3459 length:249 start_codon:yes stop_codon:yes gene_type:complete